MILFMLKYLLLLPLLLTTATLKVISNVGITSSDVLTLLLGVTADGTGILAFGSALSLRTPSASWLMEPLGSF